MADDIDQGQALDARYRAEAIADAVAGARLAAAMPGLAACCDCGDPIGAKRLKAQPSARRCIECQSALEDS